MQGLYSFLTKMLISGNLQFKRGEISLLSQPMAILSMRTVKQMNDDAIKRGKSGINDLYFEGWVFGYTFTQKLSDAFKLKKFEERYKVVMDVAAMIGFGDFKTINFYPGFAEYNVIDNPFPKLYKKGGGPVDNLLRGMNAGGSTVVHERIMNAIELECACDTGNRCHFVSASLENLTKYDGGLVQKQLDVEYLLPKQKELIKEMGRDPESYHKLSLDSKYSSV